MSNRKRIPQRDNRTLPHWRGRGRHREPSRAAAGLVALPGQTGVRLLAAGALGSAAIMALHAGPTHSMTAGAAPVRTTSTSPATATAASRGSVIVRATLTADTQPAQAAPPSAASSSTGPISNFFTATGTQIQNAASAVGQAFNNGMALQGQAAIIQAQANQALGQGLVNAFPYALQDANSWGGAGGVGGTMVGGVVGGVVGGTAGSFTVPGVGTGVGWFGGAVVGGGTGGTLGTMGGATAGFFHGLVTAPTWDNGGQAIQNSTSQKSATLPSGLEALTTDPSGSTQAGTSGGTQSDPNRATLPMVSPADPTQADTGQQQSQSQQQALSGTQQSPASVQSGGTAASATSGTGTATSGTGATSGYTSTATSGTGATSGYTSTATSGTGATSGYTSTATSGTGATSGYSAGVSAGTSGSASVS